MKTFLEPLTQEEERMYVDRFQNGDKKAKDILIERNLRLVAHIAKKYYSENRENEELISIGIVGLIKAVNTYNPQKGNRLVTYACKCIENELLMMLRSEKKKNREVSLNEPIGMDKEGNTISLIDVMENDDIDALKKMENAEDIVRVRKYVEKVLSDREKEIIIYRYGLDGREPMTQKKVGTTMGISRSYVSRIEKKALEKLKKAFDNSYTI
ncbi:RNA polymerase sporulation sigma factor SigK [uncultured Eubacterium sp.]|uniref:RNA polymerase sporulation sigma factor SigK n=1 Tax=uncultured Eubacterium sp. TaxID=165185 RepID=UPI00267343E6|nr:RNA polymerase sporulation sigma factor SigK [uncultured Eubacterium sp.]